MDKKNKAILVGVILLSFIALLIWGSSRNVATKSNLDSFAQCLSDRGATMYGAYWCSHCKNEKDAFGPSFKYINYVECAEEPNKCIENGVEGYPTWIFPDGKRFVGEQGIEKLASISGCSLNAE